MPRVDMLFCLFLLREVALQMPLGAYILKTPHGDSSGV